MLRQWRLTIKNIFQHFGYRKPIKARKRASVIKERRSFKVLEQIISKVSAENYQDLYIQWLTEYSHNHTSAPSTDAPQPSTSVGCAVPMQCTSKERRQNPRPSEPGYDWRSFQKDVKANEKCRRAQWRLIHENQRIHLRLQ